MQLVCKIYSVCKKRTLEEMAILKGGRGIEVGMVYALYITEEEIE